MKNLLLILILAPTMAFADQGNPTIDAVANALATGNVEVLTRYLSDNVEISIQDKEQMCSKTKASDVLRTFFAGNQPRGFSQMHRGASRENSDQYCIGSLNTSNGVYRVYVYFKSVGAGMLIQEMRFDKE